MRRAKIGRNNRAMVTSADASERIRLKLDRHSQTPFYRQIFQRFREAIAQGILRPGERLPSSRSLASHLSTSRGTIDLAYSLLSAEGLVVSQGAAGTAVAPAARSLKSPKSPPKSPAGLKRWAEPAAEALVSQPFQMGLPALDVFPRKLWSRLAIRHARAIEVRELAAPSAAGYEPLREAVRSYLAVSRGILCSTEQVVITSGSSAILLSRISCTCAAVME